MSLFERQIDGLVLGSELAGGGVPLRPAFFSRALRAVPRARRLLGPAELFLVAAAATSQLGELAGEQLAFLPGVPGSGNGGVQRVDLRGQTEMGTRGLVVARLRRPGSSPLSGAGSARLGVSRAAAGPGERVGGDPAGGVQVRAARGRPDQRADAPADPVELGAPLCPLFGGPGQFGELGVD